MVTLHFIGQTRELLNAFVEKVFEQVLWKGPRHGGQHVLPRTEELLKVRVPIATQFKIHEIANADGVARRSVQRVVMT